MPLRAGLPTDATYEWPDAAVASHGEEASQGINPIEFLLALKRRWLVASSAATGMALVAAALVSWLVPASEEAVAMLQVQANSPEYIASGKGSPRVSAQEVDAIRDRERQLLKSDMVLRAAVRNPKVKDCRTLQGVDDPIRFLNDEINANFLFRSDILAVSMKGPYKQDVVNIVDAVVEVYMREIVQKEHNEKAEKVNKLKEINVARERDLRNARKDLLSRADVIGTSDPTAARMHLSLDMDKLARVTKQRSDIDEQLQETSLKMLSQRTIVLNENTRKVSRAELEQYLEKDVQYQAIKSQVMQLEAEMSGPGAQGLQGRGGRSQLDEARRREADYLRVATKRVREMKTDSPAKDELKLLEQQYRFLSQASQALKLEHDKLADEVRAKGKRTEDLEEVQDRVNQLLRSTSELSSTINNLELERLQRPRVYSVQSATTPDTPDNSPRILLTIGVAVLAFGLTVVGVGFWEFTAKRINTISDATKRIGLNLVGTLPSLSKRGPSQLPGGSTDAAGAPILNDSVDSIRAALIYGSRDGSGREHFNRAIMVTSAWDGEGKSTVASQLAASLARCGRRTLLVDADLRNPTMHHLFEMPHEIGLSEILRGEVVPQAVIRETPLPGLWLLGAGEYDHRAIQALDHKHLGTVFDHLRAEYDFIIIDTPPALAFADALLIGQHVDGAILSVRLDYSQRPKIEEASRKLRAVGVRLFGVVVNGAKSKTSHRAAQRLLAPADAEEEETVVSSSN
ncbi:MAG: polysaccharide biosynthesis tyrosine autokinase [Pirellulales bacterium]